MRRQMKIAFLLALYLLCPTAGPAWSAAIAEPGPPGGPAPVFFATDREQRSPEAPLDFGGQSNVPIDQMTYGVVEPAAAESDSAAPARLNETSAQVERTYPGFEEMAQALHAALNNGGRGELVIFVHGCCIGFREALRQAKQLGKEVDRPVVFYDWGSPFASYTGSLLACPRSQERFNSFMLAMAEAFSPEKITIVGHSLGNVLIDEFLLQHRPEETDGIFSQIVFARADMDAIAFQSHIPKIVGHARRTFIYIDDHDPAINLSAFLRLVASPVLHGDRVGRLVTGCRSDPRVQIVDVSRLNLLHDLPGGVVFDMLSGEDIHDGGGRYNYVALPNGVWQARLK